MTRRLLLLVPLALVLIALANGKDKKKSQLPEYILRAQTVRVVIDPYAGEPLDEPNANAAARDSVEKALTEWGRFRLVMDGERPDLVIAIHTGDDRMARPTIKGSPADQRPSFGQTSDGGIRMGGQRGQPPMGDPSMDPQNPQNQGPHVGNEIGPRNDSLMVYQGGIADPLDSPPLWRYVAKNCLRAPQVTAVEEFRKAVADAEKPKPPKTP